MKKILIFLILTSSCSTYNRTEVVGSFRNDRGELYTIWKTDVYDRKTREFKKSEIDTVFEDPFGDINKYN